MQPRFISAIEKLNKCLTPPPDLLISEWADTYRVLSREASAEAGIWRTSRAPYFREPMDACRDPRYQEVVVKSASQMGKTELLLNIIGYYSQNDPSPMLLIQPTVEMAEAFSKDRLSPMIRDTKVLRDIFSGPKSRTANNTIAHKTFSGGQITMIGANSPSNLAMRPIRILLCDEINRYPASAGTEGNPVELAKARTTTFYNRLVFKVSTPTEKYICQITDSYEQSSKGKYCMECPSCTHPNFITRDSLVIEDLYVRAACTECGAIHEERDWKSTEGYYVHEEDNNNTRGFWINGYASRFMTWSEIEKKYLTAKESPETLKVFTNTVLAEVWEESGERADPTVLLDRRENYTEVPSAALALTMAVDVQDNRLEYEVVAWAEGLESWSMDYGVFLGDPSRDQVWQDLKDYFNNNTFSHQSGHKMKINCMAIDLGGHHTQKVYDFAEKMKPDRVWPIRGVGGWGLPLVKEGRSKNKRTGKKVTLWNIAVDQAKIWLERRLKQNEPGAGYCHFNFNNNELYFEGLTAEKLVNSKNKAGFPVKKWVLEPGKRNEPLDLRVYNYAAINMLNPVWQKLKKAYDREPDESSPPVGEVKRKKRRRGQISKGI
jgi:phage terminase large subunit GpA-like protein